MNVDELISYTLQKPRHAPRRFFAHSNHLYSVAAVTDGIGQVVTRFAYDTYGKQSILNAAGSAIVASDPSVLGRGFTGYQIDREVGLYYARARIFSPGLGRFINRDPADYVEGYNLYSGYFSPNGTDPYGLWSWGVGIDFGQILRALVEAVSGERLVVAPVFTLREGEPCCCNNQRERKVTGTIGVRWQFGNYGSGEFQGNFNGCGNPLSLKAKPGCGDDACLGGVVALNISRLLLSSIPYTRPFAGVASRFVEVNVQGNLRFCAPPFRIMEKRVCVSIRVAYLSTQICF